MEERIIELYQQGWGLKRIAWELNMPPATVRRRLISAGVYQGVDRTVQDQPEDAPSEGEELASFPEQETIENPVPPLGEWICQGDASVVRDGKGWLLSLPGNFSSELISPPLEGEQWSGRGVEVCVALRLVSPAFGSLVTGIRDAGAPFGSEANCILSSGLIPSRWHVKHLCQNSPTVFFKANGYTPVTVDISNLMLKEISSRGLNPIILPEIKRLEPGTRFNLTWQTNNGCRLTPAISFDRPNAMEINFVSFSGAYAGLPVEVQGKKVRLTLEAMGEDDIEIVLGDRGGSEKKIASLRRKPCTLQLEKDVGREGYVYLNNPSYANFKAYLGDAFIEILD